MTSRRDVLVALVVASWTPGLAFAQSRPPLLIGWLHTDSRSDIADELAAFKEGMAALGWKEGASYRLEELWAEGDLQRLLALAQELKARKPVLIVAALAQAARAAAKAVPGIPIVQANGGS